ncbi:MAG: hypothetical protein LBQ24_00280 [Candidatus Peribacteria bacterium]|nr:hypothetical protein [Candidatus Peribacteria bacterium]
MSFNPPLPPLIKGGVIFVLLIKGSIVFAFFNKGSIIFAPLIKGRCPIGQRGFIIKGFIIK